MHSTALPRHWQVGALTALWLGPVWLGCFFGLRTTTLMAPINVRFDHFLTIAGLCLAAVVVFLSRTTAVDDDMLDRVLSGSLPDQLIALVAVIGPIAAGGLFGHDLAKLTVEWRAFLNVRPTLSEQIFKVEDHVVNRKGPDWLRLRGAADAADFWIGCGNLDCRKIRVGDDMHLPVETGRAGVQRVTLRTRSDQVAQ